MLDAAAILPSLRAWVPEQRWYPRKGERVQLEIVATLPLGAAGDAAVLVVDAEGVLLQVPVVVRDEPGDAAIGRIGDRWLVDACHDREAMLAMLSPAGGLEVHGSVDEPDDIHVLRAEQSNTSVIGEGAAPWIAKVLRVVAPGEHPDVSVTSALTAAGCNRVPRLLASVEATWSGEPHTLVAVSELIVGAEDAWGVHLADATAALDGDATGHDAHGLGIAVAEVHVALAEAFGTHTASEDESRALVDDLRARLAWARAEAGDLLGGLDARLDAHAARLDAISGVGALQRIHGDLHLGQVLRHRVRGDLLLDFEGEPLRPLAERALPQPRARDVAGMLRSLDYAAGAVTASRGLEPDALAEWTSGMQSSFLAGYRTRLDVVDDGMLDAFVIDKALYELVYEMRNRPEWARIPLRAITRMLR